MYFCRVCPFAGHLLLVCCQKIWYDNNNSNSPHVTTLTLLLSLPLSVTSQAKCFYIILSKGTHLCVCLMQAVSKKLLAACCLLLAKVRKHYHLRLAVVKSLPSLHSAHVPFRPRPAGPRARPKPKTKAKTKIKNKGANKIRWENVFWCNVTTTATETATDLAVCWSTPIQH